MLSFGRPAAPAMKPRPHSVVSAWVRPLFDFVVEFNTICFEELSTGNFSVKLNLLVIVTISHKQKTASCQEAARGSTDEFSSALRDDPVEHNLGARKTVKSHSWFPLKMLEVAQIDHSYIDSRRESRANNKRI